MKTPSDRTRLCDRCLREVPEGVGKFFEIRVEAVADPTPPILDDELDRHEIRKEYSQLVTDLEQIGPLSAAEQVYRRRVWTLCNQCMEEWFTDPFENA